MCVDRYKELILEKSTNRDALVGKRVGSKTLVASDCFLIIRIHQVYTKRVYKSHFHGQESISELMNTHYSDHHPVLLRANACRFDLEVYRTLRYVLQYVILTQTRT